MAELEDAIENYDDYPVGTILQRTSMDPWSSFPFPYLIKVASVYEDMEVATGICYMKSAVPVWVYIHADFSGSTYETLLNATRGLFGDRYKVLYDPNDELAKNPFLR